MHTVNKTSIKYTAERIPINVHTQITIMKIKMWNIVILPKSFLLSLCSLSPHLFPAPSDNGSALCDYRLVLPIPQVHINRIIHQVLSRVWFPLSSIMYLQVISLDCWMDSFAWISTVGKSIHLWNIFEAILNKASTNILVCVSLHTRNVFIPFAQMPRSGIWDHMIRYVYFVKKLSRCFIKWSFHFSLPPGMCESSSGFHILTDT